MPLGAAGGRWGLLVAAGGRWGPLEAAGGRLEALGQNHLPPSLMDRKFQIFCKKEEEPYYLISINVQKLDVHYDPLGAAGGRWGPLVAAGKQWAKITCLLP